jgi:hypothetical protein
MTKIYDWLVLLCLENILSLWSIIKWLLPIRRGSVVIKESVRWY